MSVFDKLFSSDFMPHGMCYLWKPELLWLHVVSDGLIFLSYICIPVTLVYIIRQRSDLIFSKVMVLFGLFVLLCGFTHAIAVWTVWNGTYWFSGTVKGVTAIVSVATAVMLWVLVPTLKNIPTVRELEKEVESRKQVEKELQEKSRLLEEKSRLLEDKTRELTRSNAELQEFAYAASHDLRSPLNGVKKLAGWIKDDLLEEGVELSKDVQQNFEYLDSRITRLTNLLTGLLEYAKVGLIEDKVSEINTNKVFSEIFDLLPKDKSIQMYLPEKSFTFDTLASPFNQIMRNLLDNAVKHHTKLEGNIWVEANELEDFYEFKVIDDGAGVAPEEHKKILKMFSTLKPKDKVEGSGIGLALIKKIIDNVKGELRFESDVGQGMTVIILWPKNIQLEKQHN